MIIVMKMIMKYDKEIIKIMKIMNNNKEMK